MENEVFYYHDSKHYTKPKNNSFNIKGLELEISDSSNNVQNTLDKLIDENILTAPCNSNIKKRHTICIENDSSVYKELIFKACSNSKLIEGVKILEENLHNVVKNRGYTSCHIHLNNRYLNKRNIEIIDIAKSCEFIAPILYRISGRDYDSYYEWTKSTIESLIEIEDDDLYKRAQFVNENNIYLGERYRIINTNNSNTTEIRIFSNKFNFDSKYIKMYLETVDFAIDLAELMKNKNYKEEFEVAFNATKKFFEKRKFKEIYELYNLNEFFMDYHERIVQQLKEQEKYLNHMFREENLEDLQTDYKYLLRGLRNYYNKYNVNTKITIKLMNYNINEIKEKLEKDLEEKIFIESQKTEESQ